MKIIWIKGSNDKKSFKVFESLGADIEEVEDLDNTDKKIKELIKKNYTTFVMTDEIASFSEDLVKKYRKRDDIKFIIVPPK